MVVDGDPNNGTWSHPLQSGRKSAVSHRPESSAPAESALKNHTVTRTQRHVDNGGVANTGKVLRHEERCATFQTERDVRLLLPAQCADERAQGFHSDYKA